MAKLVMRHTDLNQTFPGYNAHLIVQGFSEEIAKSARNKYRRIVFVQKVRLNGNNCLIGTL
jgi:hypothetical protein